MGFGVLTWLFVAVFANEAGSLAIADSRTSTVLIEATGSILARVQKALVNLFTTLA